MFLINNLVRLMNENVILQRDITMSQTFKFLLALSIVAATVSIHIYPKQRMERQIGELNLLELKEFH